MFCGSDWSAPFIQQPSILKEYVNIIGLIGAEIKEVEFTNSYAIGLEEDMPSYIKTINLHLESERQIIFFSDFDWGGFYILDNDGHQIRIPTKDLNKYLRVPIGTKIKE